MGNANFALNGNQVNAPGNQTLSSDEMLQDINRQYTVKGDRQKYTK